jgi:hypothetical protein
LETIPNPKELRIFVGKRDSIIWPRRRIYMYSKYFTRPKTILMVALFLLLPSAIVSAGTLTIYDTTDTLFFADGTGRAIPQSSCGGEVCQILITPPVGWGATGVSFANITPIDVNIFEDSNQTVVSYTLHLQFFTFVDSAGISVFGAGIVFVSDSDGSGLQPLPNPFATAVTESGMPQFGSLITWDLPDGTHFEDSIFFVSDVSDVSDVPEPNTLALFGLALIGLGLSSRKQRNSV